VNGDFWSLYGEAAKTATGFFWKSGWAFILGYGVSAMIQAFVPKSRLTRHMGSASVRSIGLSTLFGAISSSCSFAALATARSLLGKGAHFIATVAFMFASTNLVIELGILIFIFLGPSYLAAEIVGGLVLIAISSVLIRLTYPRSWLEAARERVEEEIAEDEEFDWRRRIRSREGWRRVGHHFVGEWKMVWEEILIGFTVAGFVAVFVPNRFWETLFLAGSGHDLPAWLVALENAAVAPFIAAATFIGSMGNIPLATVLASSGVLFAGIMGFIYSDLMVPPLVRINARYYGWRVALYVAAVMYASIVATALLLNGTFALLGLVPEARDVEVAGLTQFAVDYTFWLNLLFVVVAGVLIHLHRRHLAVAEGGMDHDHGDGGIGIKRLVVYCFLALLVGGWISFLVTGGSS
jgi:uncharacterized membrane protein YraQ (UPF0718 family)